MFMARKHLVYVIHAWNEIAADKRFETLLHRLNDLKQQVLQMPQRRAERMDAMLAEAAKLQRYKFLDQIPLDKAALPKVSRQEISMLAAFDIDSAAEVLAYSEKMNGLVSEPARVQILAWANACSRRFVFDPSQGTDPVDVQQVELVLQHEQDSLLEEMRVGQEELERLASELSEARKKRERDLEAARKAVANSTQEHAP
jgi:DNA-binding helix-hairpin-helix protein with protein kinase domain